MWIARFFIRLYGCSMQFTELPGPETDTTFLLNTDRNASLLLHETVTPSYCQRGESRVVPNFTRFGNIKGVAQCRKWGGMGFWGSSKVIETSAI